MKKRVVSLLMAGVLTCAALTGCGGGNSADQTGTDSADEQSSQKEAGTQESGQSAEDAVELVW